LPLTPLLCFSQILGDAFGSLTMELASFELNERAERAQLERRVVPMALASHGPSRRRTSRCHRHLR
jgi:hypothetical protein